MEINVLWKKLIPESYCKVCMKLFLGILVFVMSAQAVLAQTDTSETFQGVAWCDEVRPVYPGGPKALQSFLVHNLKYPKEAIKHGVGGTVIIHFQVDTLGHTSNFSVYKSVCYELDQEAIRVVRMLKGWSPYTLHGKKQSTYINQPFVFNIGK